MNDLRLRRFRLPRRIGASARKARGSLLLLGLLSVQLVGARSAAAMPGELEPEPTLAEAQLDDTAVSELGLHGFDAIPKPGGYELVRTYQSDPDVPLGVLEDPSGIHVARDGTVFVVDREIHRAQRFTPEGEPMTAYGRPGDDPGELYQPSGIATDLDLGRVYIGDAGNDRIAIFNLDGTFITNWGGYTKPEAIAVAPNGRVFFYEGGSGAVRGRNADNTGDFLIGAGAHLLREEGIASGMTVGPDGNVYVAMNLGVVMFSPDGDRLGPGAPRIYPGGANITRDVTFDQAGKIYVLEANALRYEWAGGLALPVSLNRNVRAIAGGPKGTIYMIVPKSKDRPAKVDVVTVKNRDTADVNSWGVPQTVLGWLNQPVRLALGDRNDLYVVDDLRRVQRFDLGLTRAFGQWAMPGLFDVLAPGEQRLVVNRTRFSSGEEDPNDPDSAPAGMQVTRIERYDLPALLDASIDVNDRFPAAWSTYDEDPVTARDATRIQGMAQDRVRGISWTMDAGEERMEGYDADGNVVADFELPDVNSGFPAWTDVATDVDGNLYALNTAARQLFRLDRNGNILAALDLPEWSWRVAIGPDKSIFLPTARRWIWRLSPDGRRVLALWKLPDPQYGEDLPPSDIEVSAAGEVYILEQTSSAIYAFAEREGLGGQERPNPGRLDCDLSIETYADPIEIEIGQTTLIHVDVGGACDGHSRDGHQPDLLIRNGTVALSIPFGARLVSGSTQPPAIVRGSQIIWELTDVPHEGISLRYRLTATDPRRWPAFSGGAIEHLDGWFNFGTTPLPEGFFHVLIPPTPTPGPSPMPGSELDGQVFLPMLRSTD